MSGEYDQESPLSRATILTFLSGEYSVRIGWRHKNENLPKQRDWDLSGWVVKEECHPRHLKLDFRGRGPVKQTVGGWAQQGEAREWF